MKSISQRPKTVQFVVNEYREAMDLEGGPDLRMAIFSLKVLDGWVPKFAESDAEVVSKFLADQRKMLKRVHGV